MSRTTIRTCLRDVVGKHVRRHTYDAAGRLVAVTFEDLRDTYEYDAKGRLLHYRRHEGDTPVELETYGYCD